MDLMPLEYELLGNVDIDDALRWYYDLWLTTDHFIVVDNIRYTRDLTTMRIFSVKNDGDQSGKSEEIGYPGFNYAEHAFARDYWWDYDRIIASGERPVW